MPCGRLQFMTVTVWKHISQLTREGEISERRQAITHYRRWIDCSLPDCRCWQEPSRHWSVESLTASATSLARFGVVRPHDQTHRPFLFSQHQSKLRKLSTRHSHACKSQCQHCTLRPQSESRSALYHLIRTRRSEMPVNLVICRTTNLCPI